MRVPCPSSGETDMISPGCSAFGVTDAKSNCEEKNDCRAAVIPLAVGSPACWTTGGAKV